MRKGYLCYRIDRKCHELVAGSILVGHPGLEYECTHGRTGPGEGLAFRFAPTMVESIEFGSDIWRVGYIPPLAELMVVGELAQAVAEGKSDVGLDEIGVLFAFRVIQIVSGGKQRSSGGPEVTEGALLRPPCGLMPTRAIRLILRPPQR